MIRLASSPMPHVSNAVQSVLNLLTSEQSLTSPHRPLHRPIPAPEPNPEPDPAPDRQIANRYSLSPAVWDELFHAVLARLEGCVDDAFIQAEKLPEPQRSDATKTAVLDCVHAMKQLHFSLTCERQKI